MRRIVIVTVVVLSCISRSHAQPKKPLQANGWGGLTGKVVDQKNLAPVADVLVYLEPPKGTFFPIHNDDRIRKRPAIIEQNAGGFALRVSGHYPVFFDGKQMVETDETLVLKNSSAVHANFRVIGNGIDNGGFNVNVPPGTEQVRSGTRGLKPQRLPLLIRDDIHTNYEAHIAVFDHPYFAVTDKNGVYKMSRVPAGAEMTIMAWHDNVGWVLTSKGHTDTFKQGKNTFDLQVPPPK